MRKIPAFMCAVCVFCAVLLCGCRTVEVVEVEVSEEVTTTATLPVKKTTTATTDPTTSATTMQDFATSVSGDFIFMSFATMEGETTRKPNPNVSLYLDATAYEPNGTVTFHLVDPTNTGFKARSLTLWKWDGKKWVTAQKKSNRVGGGVYIAKPNSEKSYIDAALPLYLSDYKDVSRGERYKLSIYADGYEISAEFTIAEE